MDVEDRYIYKYAHFKFNHGKGALLCSKCEALIETGFKHEDKQHLCKDCTPRKRYYSG